MRLFGEVGQNGHHRRVGEDPGVGLDGDVGEARVEEEVAAAADDAGGGDQVGASVHDGAGERGVVGVDDEGVPVLSDQHDAPAGGEHAPRLADRAGRVVQDVGHLFGPVAV